MNIKMECREIVSFIFQCMVRYVSMNNLLKFVLRKVMRNETEEIAE